MATKYQIEQICMTCRVYTTCGKSIREPETARHCWEADSMSDNNDHSHTDEPGVHGRIDDAGNCWCGARGGGRVSDPKCKRCGGEMERVAFTKDPGIWVCIDDCNGVQAEMAGYMREYFGDPPHKEEAPP